MPRSEFPQAYALALGILTLGCLLLAVWLGLLILNALDYDVVLLPVLPAGGCRAHRRRRDFVRRPAGLSGAAKNPPDLINHYLAVVITKRNYNGLLTLLYCPPRYLLFCAFLISGNY